MSPVSRTPPPGSARLFSDSQAPGAPAGVHIANIDGASRGNPGPAAYAVVLRDPTGAIVLELAKQFGRDTNNVAEYYALLAALDYAATHGITALRVRSDSELLVRQMQGRYKVKSADLKPLHERASKLSRQLGYFAIEHVRRELNHEPDALANAALDQGSGGGEIRNETPRPGAGTRQASPSPSAVQPATSAPAQPQKSAHRLRARFERGVFVPTAPVDLPEGSQVLLEIKEV
jgi:probable phosphoglycerate mutase